ncbi:MAG: hypothetical protein KTR30_16215 [Saprospiraceae bacterium]|nr:hypothetical protein [Saprospiraceae bacterium]
METTALKTRERETMFPVYRDVWTRPLSHQTWSRLQLDLDRLYQMPDGSGIEISSLTPILGKEWLQGDVLHSRLTLQLLSKLMSAFVASPAYSILCGRFDLAREDGLGKLGIPVCFPLMAYWASRELPWLHRKLFKGQLKRNFWYFKRCSVESFFTYAPLFVLYRLTNVLATKETAHWVLWIISGKNLRRVPGLPFQLTRMMAHFTINAPHKKALHLEENNWTFFLVLRTIHTP